MIKRITLSFVLRCSMGITSQGNRFLKQSLKKTYPISLKMRLDFIF